MKGLRRQYRELCWRHRGKDLYGCISCETLWLMCREELSKIVAAYIRTIFAQPDQETAKAQLWASCSHPGRKISQGCANALRRVKMKFSRTWRSRKSTTSRFTRPNPLERAKQGNQASRRCSRHIPQRRVRAEAPGSSNEWSRTTSGSYCAGISARSPLEQTVATD